jgi:transposase
MRKPAILPLSEEQRQRLEQWIHSWDTAPVVRLRCQVIQLKAQGRSATDIGSIVGMCTNSVHSWVRRYQSEGICGLLTKAGRGRKKLLQDQADAPMASMALQEHRQSLKAAKAAFEASSGKQVSEDTLRFFLSILATPIKECEKGWVKSRPRSSMSIN